MTITDRRRGERRAPQTWLQRWMRGPIERRRYWPKGRRAAEGGTRRPVK